MFFENIDISVMDQSIKELEKECGIETTIPTSLSEEWATYAYLTGKNNGLNDMYCINFGYYISTFLGGMGVDAGTDIYFKLELDDYIFNLYEETQSTSLTNEEKAKQFFNTLLDFYSSENILKYEKVIFTHNHRIPSEVKTWFKKQEQPIKKTLLDLMRGKISCPHIWGDSHSENLSFKLTFSEQEEWNKIGGENNYEKLRRLLYG